MEESNKLLEVMKNNSNKISEVFKNYFDEDIISKQSNMLLPKEKNDFFKSLNF